MQEMPLLLVLAPGCILLVAFALLFGLGPKQLADENDDDDDEERDHRPHIYACRYCREPIHVEAIRCPHCRSDLPIDRAAERLRPR
jgi:hypothetical protein